MGAGICHEDTGLLQTARASPASADAILLPCLDMILPRRYVRF